MRAFQVSVRLLALMMRCAARVADLGRRLAGWELEREKGDGSGSFVPYHRMAHRTGEQFADAIT